MTNIALIVLDTLRKDAFDRHFDWLPGRRFEHAYATANWTVPSHASLFTGRYASEVGVHAKNMYFDYDGPVLAERLRDAGYTTRAFSANTNITAHFDFDRGFTDFRTPERFDHMADDSLFDWREFSRTTPATGPTKYLRAVYECIASDAATVPSLITGLKLLLSHGDGVEYGGTIEAMAEFGDEEFGDREFLFLNLMEAHEPYRAPPEYMSVAEPPLSESVGDVTIGDVNAERTRRAYDDCARYLSDVYRDLFERLAEDFDYVITLSDHGEMLGEFGAWGHEHGVYPELTHVPLSVYGEGLDGVTTDTVGLIDVHRTVLDLAGIEGGGGRGRNLIDDAEPRERLTEYLGLTAWSERKLETNGYEREAERYDGELRGYAADDGYYAFETVDGFERTDETVDDGRERLARLVDELRIRRVERNNDVPDEIKDRLEDLGYA
ncbi:sulfatase-like hydrolase/transferase [Halegenticoccus soli]|uniref:sulfatase-like hydrolase/transferase n=1 Tax=Halegenticoccus soli TaxID=1985678 RepID=UPI000C6D20DE|nr:sulfatase-like hydrolase/transferase [Halegenticoccus soli]